MSTTQSLPSFQANGQPDWALLENVDSRQLAETHLAQGEPGGACRLTKGSRSLGSGNAALSVAAGTVVVNGETFEIAAQSVDLPYGDDEPRRDVVYIDGSGDVQVRLGQPAPLVWADELATTAETLLNAHRPAPPDLVSTSGFVLGVVTVEANSASLPTQQCIHDPRVGAPIATPPNGGSVEFDAMDTPDGRTNREWVLPADVDDFGVAFNALAARVPEGGTIRIPDTEYTTATAAVCDVRSLSVVCEGTNEHPGSTTLPVVTKTADVPVFRIEEFATLHPPRIRGSGDDTSPGILAHTTSTIRDPHIRSVGSHAIELYQRPGGSVNNSSVTGVMSTLNDGDAVHIDKDPAASTLNVNALEVDVRYSRKDSGWAVYQRAGFGNDYRVLEVAGHEVGSGGMHLGVTKSNAEIIYHEGLARPTFKLDGEHVTAGVWRTGPNNDNIFDVSDAIGPNTLIQHTRTDMPEVQRGGALTVPLLSAEQTLSRIYATGTGQSIPSETFTTIQYDSVTGNSLGGADVANDQVTVPADGTYQLLNNVRFAGMPAGSRVIARIDAGGVEVARADSHAAVSGGAALAAGVSDTRELTAGDAVTGLVWQDSGGALGPRMNETETFLTVSRVG